MKKHLLMLIAVVLVLAMIPVNAFAGTVPEGSINQDGTVYTVTGDVSNILDLECFLDKTAYPNLTAIKLQGNLTDGNLAHLAHFGDTYGDVTTARVPRIQMTQDDLSSGYPFKVLPAFDTANKTFMQSHQQNSKSHHAITQDYAWKTYVTYVYDSTRNNSVIVDHQVFDENGTAMLQYSTMGSNSYPYTTSGQNVTMAGLNVPKLNSKYDPLPFSANIQYTDSIWGYTFNPEEETTGSRFGFSTSYTYNIYPAFMSTVGSYFYGDVLGSIEILKTDKNKDNPKPLEGAQFKIYTNEGCTDEALMFNESYTSDADMFKAVGTVTTKADGKALVEGLPAGDYWVVETAAPKGYVLDSTPKKVTIKEEKFDIGLDKTSGEGTTATINKETTYWEPVWEGNGAKSTLALVAPDGVTNTEDVLASDYFGDVFIKAGGSTVNFNKPADVAKLESYTHLTDNKIKVVLGDGSAAGKIENSYDTMTAALAYVNDTLITGKQLDADEKARDHVSIVIGAGENKTEGNYYLSTEVASVTFEDELIPVDVEVKKVWVNDNKADRPASVKVQLFRDGKEFGDPVVLEERNNWSAKWQKLEGGHEYTVDEVGEVEGYAKSVSHEGNSWTITNSKDSPNTGDNSGMLFIAAAAAMIAGIYVALKLRKENC